MKIRRLHWLLILPLALVLVILLAAGWTLRSEQGARWLFSRLAEMLPGRLEAVAVEGSLASGLELSGLVFEDGNARLEANAVSLAVNVDLLPPAVHVERLDARRLTVHMHGGGGEPTDWRALLPELALPIPVSVEDARVTEFDLRDSSGKKSLTLDGIELSARLHRDLVIDSLAVFTSAHRIELQGSMGFAAPYPLRAQLQSSGDSSIRFTADGTLSSAAVTLRSEQPRLDLNGRIGKLLSEPEWALEIASPLLEWPVGDPDVPIRARSLTAKSSGTLAGYRVTLNGILEADGLEPAQVELTGTGDDGSFAIDRLLMSSPEYLLRASGKSAWTAQPSLKLDAALERLDLHGWIPAWPDQQAVNGRLALAWDQHGLRLPDFELVIRDTPAKVSGEASIDTQTGSIDARLGWSALAWPPGSESPRIQSEIGALSASGRLEDWRIEGSINLEADGLAASDITLSGIGDSRSVELTLHRGSFLDGSVAGRLNWNWSGEMPFAVHLEGDNVSTTPLAPDFPGKLSTRVEAEGTLQPLEMEVTLHRLDGRVRDIPVSAKGGLHFGQGTVHARKLAARTGPSSFFIDGNLFDESGLNFELDVDSLSLYAPELEGRLKGNGLVSLYAGAPQFRARLSGSNLAFGDVTLSSIEIQDGDAAGGSELRLEGLDFDGQTIDSLTLVAAGAQPVQTIALNAAIGESAVEANLRGGIVDWTDPLGSGWSGLLAGLRLEYSDSEKITSTFPGPVSAARGMQPCAWTAPGAARNRPVLPLSWYPCHWGSWNWRRTPNWNSPKS
jgi:autotransporter translocation and assembly factor TamB